MFPPLCFIDVTSGVVPDSSKKQLQNNLSSEEYSLVSSSTNSSYNIKFKLIEFFEQNGLITAQNK